MTARTRWLSANNVAVRASTVRATEHRWCLTSGAVGGCRCPPSPNLDPAGNLGQFHRSGHDEQTGGQKLHWMRSLRRYYPVPGGAASLLGEEVIATGRSLLKESAGVRNRTGFEREPTRVTVQRGGQHAIGIFATHHARDYRTQLRIKAVERPYGIWRPLPASTRNPSDRASRHQSKRGLQPAPAHRATRSTRQAGQAARICGHRAEAAGRELNATAVKRRPVCHHTDRCAIGPPAGAGGSGKCPNRHPQRETSPAWKLAFRSDSHAHLEFHARAEQHRIGPHGALRRW